MISEKLSDQKKALKSAIFMLKYFFKNFSRPKFCVTNVSGVGFTPRVKKKYRVKTYESKNDWMTA